MSTSLTTDSLPAGKENLATFKTAAALGVFAALLAALFFERIAAIVDVWSKDGNYSHGFLILPISAWLAYRATKNSSAPLRPECLLGSCTMALGVLILLGTSIFRFMIVDFLALALLLRGAAVVIGGRAWASQYSFPIFFLFFMFPLPVTWTNFAAVWLQDWVSVVSGKVLELFFVCHQQGNRIMIAGVPEPGLHVAQECSGLRQLVAFVALATLVGYLSKKGAIGYVLLIAAAVPIAIFSNVMRILVMATVIRYFGAEWVSGRLHDVPALITLPIGLVLYFLLLKFIGSFFPAKTPSAPGVP
jgi:exosortase